MGKQRKESASTSSKFLLPTTAEGMEGHFSPAGDSRKAYTQQQNFGGEKQRSFRNEEQKNFYFFVTVLSSCTFHPLLFVGGLCPVPAGRRRSHQFSPSENSPLCLPIKPSPSLSVHLPIHPGWTDVQKQTSSSHFHSPTPLKIRLLSSMRPHRRHKSTLLFFAPIIDNYGRVVLPHFLSNFPLSPALTSMSTRVSDLPCPTLGLWVAASDRGGTDAINALVSLSLLRPPLNYRPVTQVKSTLYPLLFLLLFLLPKAGAQSYSTLSLYTDTVNYLPPQKRGGLNNNTLSSSNPLFD